MPKLKIKDTTFSIDEDENVDTTSLDTEMKRFLIDFNLEAAERIKAFKKRMDDRANDIYKRYAMVLKTIPQIYHDMKVPDYIEMCKKDTPNLSTGNLHAELEKIVPIPSKRKKPASQKKQNVPRTWTSEPNLNEINSGSKRAVPKRTRKPSGITDDNYGSGSKSDQGVTEVPTANQVQTRSATAKQSKKRPFAAFATNQPDLKRAFSGSLKGPPSSIPRPCKPGEKFYLISESGSPLSRIGACSMPSVIFPLEDGTNVALSPVISNGSLGEDFLKVKEKLTTCFGHLK